jgi:transcriptional regulator with XRE-family HTH domain
MKDDYKIGLRRRYLDVFEEVLRELNKEKKTTAKDLTEMLGMRQASIAEFKAGRRTPTVEEVLTICDKFGYDLAFVIRGSDSSALQKKAITLDDIFLEINKLSKLIEQQKR